jgi:hypothetical protein
MIIFLAFAFSSPFPKNEARRELASRLACMVEMGESRTPGNAFLGIFCVASMLV